MMDWVIAIIAFFIIAPAVAWTAPFLYGFWERLPKLLRYVFFFPIAALLGSFASFLITLVFFRDYMGRTDADSFIFYIMQVVAQCGTLVAASILIVFLCPDNERKILKWILGIYLVFLSLSITVTAYVKVVDPNFDMSITDLVASIIAIPITLIIWKNVDALYKWKYRIPGEQV